MENKEKIKLTFQTIRDGNKYKLVYLVNGIRHVKTFSSDNSEVARETIKRLEKQIRKHYEN